jgi:hypothetical protein
MATELTTAERKALDQHERTIERGLKTFQDVGQALLAIRENRLYLAEHETFADYCRERWGFNDSRARQLIAAAKTAETVTNVTLPNEAVAREVAKVPEEQREAVIEWATEKADGKPLTARGIKTAAAQVSEAEPEEDDCDGDSVDTQGDEEPETPEEQVDVVTETLDWLRRTHFPEPAQFPVFRARVENYFVSRIS